ncbi:hypothetical protein PENPOL_c007G03826 [Penicillium polonicum]|uniref:Uncharacterized protein n=1 Tax=Penicillium polonicum TaxID=60169 RepID=A0A1V6NIC6_PENPO|nr:hypothetical protein PENPOL_c007G03826 [Penicillium polonicum]
MTCPLKRWMCYRLAAVPLFLGKRCGMSMILGLCVIDGMLLESNSMNPFEIWMNGGMDNIPEWCVDAVGVRGETAQGHFWHVLSDEHVDANAVGQEGKTALHYMVRNGDTDTPRTYLLLDNVGLDPNFGDAGG